MAKVTVIIPVYNASRFIENCCNRLFSQTLDDMQFVFVDDCSTDDSIDLIRQILSGYNNRKNQVIILHQPHNMGVSAARQRGLEAALGEFVIHCDSDDWPSLNMYENLYSIAITNNADVVCCDFQIEYGTSSTVVRFPDSSVNHPSFDLSPVEGAVWNKLIRRSLLLDNGIQFPQSISLGEDCYVVTAARIFAKKECVVHQPLYHYNQQNTNSITHNYNKVKFLEVVKWVGMFEQFLQEKGLVEKYASELNYMKFQAKTYFLIFKEVRDINLWKSIFPESDKDIMKFNTKLYIKICSWMACHHMGYIASLLLSLKDNIQKLINK